MIACTTTIGRGIPRVEGQRAAHGGRVFKEDTDAARQYLGWSHAPFEIPEDILSAWREAGRRSVPEYEAWQARVAAMDPDKRRTFDRLREGRLPEGWEAALLAFKQRAAETRQSDHGYKISGDIVELLAKAIPELISGAPDLEGATLHKRKLSAFTASDRSGRYVHYGVREHVMASMLNGMASHGGVVPLGVTYLVFSDYNRAPMRMSALMGLPVKYVFSHQLDRDRQQRADPPAGRVPRLVPGDAQHAGAAPCGCGGGGRVLADRHEPSYRPLRTDVRAPAARRGADRRFRREPVEPGGVCPG